MEMKTPQEKAYLPLGALNNPIKPDLKWPSDLKKHRKVRPFGSTLKKKSFLPKAHTQPQSTHVFAKSRPRIQPFGSRSHFVSCWAVWQFPKPSAWGSAQRVGHDWETELNWQSQAITPGSAAHREQTIGVLGCHYCTLKWYHMVFISFWLSSLTVMISRSMLLPMAQFCSFLWLSHIRRYLCTNSSVSISLLMNI